MQAREFLIEVSASSPARRNNGPAPRCNRQLQRSSAHLGAVGAAVGAGDAEGGGGVQHIAIPRALHSARAAVGPLATV